MKFGLKNIVKILIMFGGSGLYFFYESAVNTKGLIINHIFVLNAEQANTFYFVMGWLGLLLVVIGVVGFYILNKKITK